MVLIMAVLGSFVEEKPTQEPQEVEQNSEQPKKPKEETPEEQQKPEEKQKPEETETAETQPKETEENEKNIADIGANFTVSDVRNDKTGKWKISSIAENIEIQEYAESYYKTYFKNDAEIHAIVNFSNNTTTKISVMGNILDVSIHDYVDGEEHDANLLYSGTLLKQYFVYLDTGEIEEIQ